MPRSRTLQASPYIAQMRSALLLGILCGLVSPLASQDEPQPLVLAVLRAGTPKEPLDNAQLQEVSAQHMANIERLVKEGSLLFAGPLVPTPGTSKDRGIFVLNVSTLDEARKLVATDPAIAAGALDAQLSLLQTHDPLQRIPELERAARQAQQARGQTVGPQMRAWILASAASTPETLAAIDKLRTRHMVAFAATCTEGPDAGVWVALDTKDPQSAQELLDEVSDSKQWTYRTWYGSVHHNQLPRLSRRADAPSFEILEVTDEGRFAPFHTVFDKRIDVFGVQVLGTPKLGKKKMLHAAHVMAQYLDNDEDGEIDDPRIHRRLVDGGAFLAMAETEREFQRIDLDLDTLEERGFQIGQDLYGEETLPDGPPHVRKRGRFDASLEEVWHLVSNGWEAEYPDTFGYQPGSTLCDAMDLARGGRFRRIPRSYPEGAWYHYDDRSCDYSCMAAEYFYWALTSLLHGQNYPGRAREIAHEWECPTAESLAERDKAVHALLTDPRWALPRMLPDGSYNSDKKK